MGVTAEQVVVQLRADMADYDRRVTNSTRLSEQSFGRIGAASDRMATDIRKNSTAMSTALKGLAATLAASFTGREFIALTDSFTRIQNNLKVAGLEGEGLRQVQERLRQSASQYGVELEGLSSLFGSLTQASKELGASQTQIFGITDAVSASLKITGLSAQQAQGALLQLGQALRGGKVQAEEYNSLLDGLYPLLEAAANGSEKFGGSVAKLTAAVKGGNVTSKEFFDDILRGSDILENRAAKATLTTGAAFATLRNELVLYFGETSQSSGATAALAEAIRLLADNLDTVIPALAVISTALGVGFVTNAGRAAIAAKGVGTAFLGAFGGPVGIAITGITVALVGLANETARTRQALDRVDDIANDAARALDDAASKADSAASGVKGVGSEAATSERKVRAFAGAVGDAAQKLYDLARARQQALISDLEARRQEASVEYSSLSQKTDANIRRNLNTPGQGIGTFLSALGARTQRVLGIGPTEAEVQGQLDSLRDAMDDYDAAIRNAATNLARFAQPSEAVAAISDTSGTKKGRKGKSDAEREAERRAEAEKAVQERVAATTAELRQQLLSQDLISQGMDVEAEKADAIFRLRQQFPELVNTENAKLKDQLALMESLTIASIDRAEAEKKYSEQLDAAKEEFQRAKNQREREARQAEIQVQSLADVYETAFTRGTDGIWAQFKAAGIRAIAETLARFTLGDIGGSGGGGGLLGAVVGSVLGFAGGGSFQIGGRGGTDRNTLSLNGRPIANVSRGETINVSNTPFSRGGGGAPVINQTFVLDARYGITTPELIQYVNQTAAQEGQKAYSSAVRDTPVVQARRQRFGS